MASIDDPADAERGQARLLAICLAFASVVVAVAASALWAFVITRTTGAPSDLAPLMTALGTGVAPVLAVASGAFTLHGLGVLTRRRASATVVLAAVAFPLAALAALSWSLGFDLADEGLPMSGLATATAPLMLGAVVSGAVLLGLVVHALVRHAGISSTAAVGLALVAAVVGVPLIGWGFLVPSASAALAVAALLLAALTSPRERPAASIRPSTATGARRPDGPDDRLAAGLARLAAGAGILGVAFALAGPAWWPVPIGGTEAMIVGISILLAAGVPLLASLVLLVGSRFPGARALVRGCATALALALALMGHWYTSAPDGDANWWAVSVASVFVGVAVGGMSALLPVARPVAIAVGLGVALALAGAQVAAFLPMLAFAVPLLAIIVVVLDSVSARRREREDAATAATA